MRDSQLLADLRALEQGSIADAVIAKCTPEWRTIRAPHEDVFETCRFGPKAYLNISRTPAETATLRTLEAALDPRGSLNPGKLFDVQGS
jgi:hypothetical protein